MFFGRILKFSVVAGLSALLAAPAMAAAPTAVQIAKARQLVLLSGISRSFELFVPKLDDQITTVVTRTRPELADDLQAVLTKLQPEFKGHESEILDQAARIYANHLSEDQITQAVAFFGSDAGKAYVGQEPVVLNELVVSIHDWSQLLAATMMTRVHEEMRKRGRNF